MGDKKFLFLAFTIILVQEGKVEAAKDNNPSQLTEPSQLTLLQNVIYNQSHHGRNYSKDYTKNLSRIKRQYPYRDRYYPLPIIVGGVGYPAFGPRGYGGRGYGGRGFGGRGIGGRGFGGRGFGGRGIGGRGIGGRGIGGRGIGGRGIGGRGGIGGGRGGRG